MIDVIITYKGHPDDSDSDEVERHLSIIKRRFSRLPMQVVSVPACMLERLSRNPNIEIITMDKPVISMSVSAQATANLPSETIDYTNPGWGLGVAVLDSGVGSHVDLWPAPIQFDFLTDPNAPTQGLYDGYGHGSHVAGIIGGDGYDSNGTYRGVAPYVDIVSL